MNPPVRVSRFRTVFSFLVLRSPFWERSRKHRAGRLVLRLVYTYMVVLVILLWLENWMLFRSSPASEAWWTPPVGCVPEDVWLTTADGTPIHAWWMKPPDWTPGQGAMLYCHGNGGNLSHRGNSLAYWVHEQDLAVLIFDYPGYGKSGGKPSEAGCYAAADAAYDWLTAERQVPANRVIVYGGSLGGAVAVDLASRRPSRALLLVSTFTSFPDMAQKQFPFLPGRWLVHNQFNSLAKMATVKAPVFITHSTADGLIPFAMGRSLFDATKGLKEFFTLEGLPHHDAGSEKAFAAFAAFLKKQAP